MENIKIQLNKNTMLSGPALTLHPRMAIDFGGIIQAVVYRQLCYLADKNGITVRPIRISYTNLQKKYFPFTSRRWLIEVIQQLEHWKLIAISRTGRIKEIEIVNVQHQNSNDDTQGELVSSDADSVTSSDNTEMTSLDARMQVSIELAKKIGLLESIALQQIHIRHKDYDGSVWVIRSYEQWQRDVFMFVGISRHQQLTID